MKPLEKEILKRRYNCVWYIPKNIENLFPYSNSTYTTNINDIKNYKSDAIFVPGNEVPHFLQGIKVQIFHGLAGEKKGHFRIRDYFDLYLTQGPYFTNRFQELASKHKNFKVKETGWCKLDDLYTITMQTKEYKLSLLKQYDTKHIILYSPTFSPSLTSGVKLLNTIEKLSNHNDILVIIKFHDKMDTKIKKKYHQLGSKNLIISDEKDITPLLQISDLMISDTSSVVYEFILLDKPVITLNSISENINWLDINDETRMLDATLNIISGKDTYKNNRQSTIKQYHPYNDGKSAKRMIDATLEYEEQYGIPVTRKLPLLRKFKIYKKYGLN
ncbi:MAG: CDP-glycerol glycerophosphotransferase family protein [Arcobacteraceae bacterium]|nr:CDP-glycerol glycerophosphotransferase family protein [Arcobacteraceae bacterium]